MSYYPQGNIISKMTTQVELFEKVYKLQSNTLGGGDKSASEQRRAEILVALVDLIKAGMEHLPRQMELEAKLLNSPASTQDIVKSHDLFGRWKQIPNWEETYTTANDEKSRFLPIMTAMLYGPSGEGRRNPIRGQRLLLK